MKAKAPDCGASEQWPASMAFVYLKNAGITSNGKLDLSQTKTLRIASERIGRDLYRQVYDITFKEKAGASIEVLTVSDASSQECSMGDVTIYLVAKRLGR